MTGGATACPQCGTENVPAAKFCVECGTSLGSCPSCGHPAVPGQKFCSECGTPLRGGHLSTVRARAQGEQPGPDAAELRTVSVLFVDLVGFTALAESADPEDMRDLLGQYFAACRRIVNQYGGRIEKFIGDAVMAVWGTPLTREDDAERAVRAALEIVEAADALGGRGEPDLRVHAGVVTGQAALVAKPDEGLVVGDRVNTAARIQAVAEPGAVLVDDVTRQLTSAAISYQDAGHHQLKGKSDPIRLWRAIAVLAARPDLDRDHLYARFVGRDVDLRLVKELFHAGVERRSARLVAVSGPAGVGKTRFRWEFLNYLGGLPQTVLWHPGRCLPYRHGVAYWALAEMVRHRLGIREDEAPEDVHAKLRDGVHQWIDDAGEREFVSLRVGLLLGVAEAGPSREELFAGWRIFFERLAEHDPVVMAFEDMHWADDGLLDFVEYLLDWSAQHRIFILTFARPELTERRPGWPAGYRSATSLYLEPLGEPAMTVLLDSIATLPEAAKQTIISRAEGIPLYATETLRALVDRGSLVNRGGTLVLTTDLGELDVPASLTSLLGARLDALGSEERDLVKSMSVFGGSFPRAAVHAVGEVDPERAVALLGSLVRKQVLTVRADPLSPDRGQYRFAQGMLRTVAYEMLSRRERKSRHLAAGQYLSQTFANEGEDVAEVVAAHYLQAYRCAANDADAERLRAEALAALRRGAERAAALGAPQAAESAYRSAIDLAGSEEERIALMEAAGQMALVDGRHEPAVESFEAASVALQALGRTSDSARLSAKTGEALRRAGRASEAIDRMRAALAVLDSDHEDVDVAEISLELGVALLYTGQVTEAAGPIERALGLAQALELQSVLASALTYKAVLCDITGRVDESRILFEGAIDFCRRNELSDPLFRAQLNSGDLLARFDLPGAEERTRDALGTARRIGSRLYESLAVSNLMRVCEYKGSWSELERLGGELLSGDGHERPGSEYLRVQMAILNAYRGETAAAREHLSTLDACRAREENQLRWMCAACEAIVHLAFGDSADALAILSATIREVVAIDGPASQANRLAFPAGIEAAVSLSELDEAADLLSLLERRPAGLVPPYLRAQLGRGRGLVAGARGDHALAKDEFGRAIEQLKSLGYPYWVARVQLEYAALLIEDDRAADVNLVIEQAMTGLQPLGALPALRHAEAMRAGLVLDARA